jgi:hypothetical protein
MWMSEPFAPYSWPHEPHGNTYQASEANGDLAISIFVSRFRGPPHTRSMRARRGGHRCDRQRRDSRPWLQGWRLLFYVLARSYTEGPSFLALDPLALCWRQ